MNERVRRSSRVRYFIELGVGIIVYAILQIFVIRSVFFGVGATAFAVVWARSYKLRFPVPSSYLEAGMQENLLEKLSSIESQPTQRRKLTKEELDRLGAIQVFAYRHHNLIFYGGAAIALGLAAWIWVANNLSSALGL